MQLMHLGPTGSRSFYCPRQNTTFQLNQNKNFPLILLYRMIEDISFVYGMQYLLYLTQCFNIAFYRVSYCILWKVKVRVKKNDG